MGNRVSRIVGFFYAFISALLILGWNTDHPSLNRFLNNYAPAAHHNVALGFVICGFGLFLPNGRWFWGILLSFLGMFFAIHYLLEINNGDFFVIPGISFCFIIIGIHMMRSNVLCPMILIIGGGTSFFSRVLNIKTHLWIEAPLLTSFGFFFIGWLLLGESRWKLKALKDNFKILLAGLSAVATAGLLVLGFSIYVMYRVGIDQKKEGFRVSASNIARTFSDISSRNNVALQNTIDNMDNNYKGFGNTGEFVIAKRGSKGKLIFLLHRINHKENKTILSAPVVLLSLHNNSSGSVVTNDYRGKKVVAGYAYIDHLDWGVVCKMDLSEIRKPYIRQCIVLFLTYVCIVIVGSSIFANFTIPILKDIQDTKEKLQESNKELESFAYIASHDLKSPLRGVNQLSIWIKEELESLGVTSDQLNKYVSLMDDRVHKMESLIGGILKYSLLGHKNMEVCLIDTNRVVNEIIEELQTENFKITKTNLPSILVDRTQIKQVLSNLIENSIVHHNKKEGNIHVSCISKNNYYEFSVQDDGPGIDPKNHKKIFDLFTSISEKENMTGIGLSLVKKIIKNCGGYIKVKSKLGSGAEFVFCIPKPSDT